MSSDAGDLSAVAAIRIAATQLFAERGYAAVTVRQIAVSAGVSPALVIHHYGSKEQLRAAIDERVAVFIESMLAAVAAAPGEGDSASIAELFAAQMEREPAMAAYMRRLLADGSPAGISLFERLYQATQAGMQALGQAGVVRPAHDERVRSAFLLANDLAMILLRPHITQVTGIDPLSRTGLNRWSAEVMDVYSNGVFTIAAAPAQAADAATADREGESDEPSD